ncbi:putative ABC transporter ATP-binding protein YbhF [bacterium BMS3Abin05]|nr:putative ABC transporter ATP-binding protein YbhF [bacterium BMS3Abin05]GBE26612.1 putative ABC transporter ATP-binding protein YbhF [bacterium BMS3Bbin03]HDZ11288.1 ABC transporter ATP-binding protein [Bacteroidota bacterium]
MPAKISAKIEQLTRRFGKFVAVNRVSLEVYQGEIFGFLGANGAGKTTLIRMLSGLLTPSSGSATVAGFDVMRESEAVKKNIGYMSQRFSLYADLTVEENMEFYGGIYGLPNHAIQAWKNAFFEKVGLTPFVRRLTHDVPLGFKQRLALGCALIHNPPVLFLDEPTSGVDPEARREFWNLLYELADQGKTIFVTTHFMDEAEYCHRVAFMRLGNLVIYGTPTELKRKFNQTSMQDVFLKLSGSEEDKE